MLPNLHRRFGAGSGTRAAELGGSMDEVMGISDGDESHSRSTRLKYWVDAILCTGSLEKEVAVPRGLEESTTRDRHRGGRGYKDKRARQNGGMGETGFTMHAKRYKTICRLKCKLERPLRYSVSSLPQGSFVHTSLVN